LRVGEEDLLASMLRSLITDWGVAACGEEDAI